MLLIFHCAVTLEYKNLRQWLFIQTEEEQAIQMVDMSFAISNIPSCLETNQSILATILRGVEIVLTQPQDSDDESPEMQIVFQPVSCQSTLKIMEQLLTVLDKGIFFAFFWEEYCHVFHAKEDTANQKPATSLRILQLQYATRVLHSAFPSFLARNSNAGVLLRTSQN